MSTIRPLATIAILAVIGVFLAQQINKSPVVSNEELAAWSDAAPAFDPASTSNPAPSPSGPVAGAPPIDAPSFGAPSFGGSEVEASSAPVASGVPAIEAPPVGAPSFGGPAPVAIAPDNLPPLPQLPDEVASPATDPLADLPLPSNIPEANYDAPPAAAPAPPTVPVPPVSVAPATNEGEAIGRVYGSPTSSLDLSATSPGATSPLPPAPAVSEPVTPVPATPIPGGFAAARPAIEGALARRELARALLLLSPWHGDPSLSPGEQAEVATLLSQLAGTVVYSGEHLLEGPYTVRPGETLETIAEQQGVPWQLLAKINGVGNPAAITPGSTLKVVRGPFGATVDLSDGELFLTIGGRYAGRFPVTFPTAAPTEGVWRIEQKQATTGKQIVMSGSFGTQAVIADQAAPAPAAITVADRDMGDLFDILSVGSEVTVRR